MTEPTIMRGDIWWVSLDPTQGSEIKKTRPCVVLTHNTINRLRRTVVVVPLSTAAKSHPPIAVPVNCQGGTAVAVVDQIRAVSKHRLKKKIEALPPNELDEICRAVSTILEIR
jgi:mRNA interferase MazF